MQYLKNLQTILLLALIGLSTVMAQVPEQFRLQGVARDNGQILASAAVDVRVTIYESGISAYQEIHAVSTDAFGQFGIDVGDGAPVSGSFSQIAWETAPITYDIELDAGSGYFLVGNDAFQSVPYALVARTASEMALGDLTDVFIPTPPAANQILQWNGNEWVLGNDAFTDGDSDPTNEFQALSLVGSTLSISNGNSVTIPASGSYVAGTGIAITGNVISNTGDTNPGDDIVTTSVASGDVQGTFSNLSVVALQGIPVNNLPPSTNQVLKFIGGQWVPSTDNTNDADADPSNEIQSMILSGNQLSLSNGGGTVALPTYGAGVGIFISGGNLISNSGDLNGSDDVNIGDPAGGDLGGTYPSPVVTAVQGVSFSAATPASGQVLKFSAGQWTPQDEFLSQTVDTIIYQGGAIMLQTPAGDTRAMMGIDAGNNGYLQIYDNTNTLKAGIRMNAGVGEVFGDSKNFRMDHPEDASKEIWYASLEGPEAAAYVRGTGTLTDGEGEVTFPEHFQLVANAESMTVMLTPLSGQSKGLAVVEKTATGFKVVELLEGEGDYSFDWEVKCVRQGFEHFSIIRDKQE